MNSSVTAARNWHQTLASFLHPRVIAMLFLGFSAGIPILLIFSTASTTVAILFTAWCAFVGLIDNFLKPILFGRGVEVPTIVIFLGAIGGMLAMGIIGLFVGAVVLGVGYELFKAWIESSDEGSASSPASA